MATSSPARGPRRHHRARLLDGRAGVALHAHPGRLRGERREGRRAAAPGRRADRAALLRLRRRPGHAAREARPEGARRPGRVPAPRRARRRGDRELPARRRAAPRHRLRGGARAEPAHRLLLHVGLRPGGPGGGLGRPRPQLPRDGRLPGLQRAPARAAPRRSPARPSPTAPPAGCTRRSRSSRRCCAAARRGEGEYLDVAVADGVLSLMAPRHRRAPRDGRGGRAPATTSSRGRYACYGVYRCRDGRWLAVARDRARLLREPVSRPRPRGVDPAPERGRGARRSCAPPSPPPSPSATATSGWRSSPPPTPAWRRSTRWRSWCATRTSPRAAPSSRRSGRAAAASASSRPCSPAAPRSASRPGSPAPHETDTDALLRGAGYSAEDVAALRSEGVIA